MSWSWDAATQTLTQTALVAIAFIHGTSVNNVIHTMSGSAAGNNQLFAFGTGTNTLYASSSGNDSLYAGPGGTNTLIGGSGNDTFYGNTGTNIEIGGSGTDTFYGGTGTNALTGGTGNDTFYVNSTATTVTAQSSGTNTNTVYSTVNFTLPANVQTLYLSGQGLTGRANNQGDSIYADPTYGGTIYGGVGTDYLCANGSGNVQIYAGNGTANLYGGSRTDLLVGGTGQNISTFTVRRPL